MSSALIFALPLVGFGALPPDRQAARREFAAAMQRVRSRQPDTTDSPALKSYAIYDYLVAARLRRDLTLRPGESLDAAVDAFLQGHAGYPVARSLRRDWLVSLGQRRRWDWFLPRSQDAVDPVLICDRLEGRLSSGDTAGLANAALAVWTLPQKPLPECDAVFAWLRQNGLLTAALAESRSRAALAADSPHLAREFAADVPVTRRAALLQWSDLLESPKSALTVLATHPSLPVEAEALAAGFDKLAHNEPTAALDLLPRLLARDQLAPDLRTRLRRSAALGAAYDHDPRSMALLDDLPAAAIDSQTQEWRVRSAVWIGDYAKALLWIEQMPTSLFAQPRWRYWRARAVAATMGEEAAAPLWREIAGLRDYYGYLAADRLHQNYSLNARPSPVDAAAQSALAAEPGLVRAHELFDCDMSEEATTEWTAAVGGADSAMKVQAALLASHWGWYAEAIATLAQTGEFDDVNLRYPRPYLDTVSEASALARVPPDWILAVMRQESLFRKDAVSRADARGVMQMLPGTASALARRWHISAPAREALFDPAVAIPLGAAYLRELLDRSGGQLALSLAAYNGGPAAVARWLPHSRMDADVWIENIPYNETRGYVQHILEHIIAFAWVRDAEPPRLETLLPAIEPATPVL
ncbi:MAG TPA: transglycosylase SLT domain-containing protein [Steroidobacteraceae bacterium]|nr:transglycosylase SLT domain-containing protein [Steroidobacteraceae bacterium]